MSVCHRITPVLVVLSCWAASISAQDRFPVQRLTFDPAQEGFPSWSPDGATIVYSYLDRRESGIVAGLHTVASVGGEPQWLTDEIGEHPNWSREGHYIVFDADMGNSIKITSARGGQARKKRNRAEYDSVGAISVGEADEVRMLAEDLRARVAAWLEREHTWLA